MITVDKAQIRVRVSERDVHYAGGLVPGSYALGLIGDALTELAIKHDGDEGLWLTVNSLEFRIPVRAGDYLEVPARIIRVGKTSREAEFEVRKVITSANLPDQPSAADLLEEPVLVVRGKAVIVVPKEMQRKRPLSAT